MAKALVGLGANSGDRLYSLQTAVARLNQISRIRVLANSNWHATDPVGGPDGQPDFLNGAVVLETDLTPRQLLGELQSIENQLGRRREIRWDARTLDLDLLLYDDFHDADSELVVPHPRMVFRPFVLVPAMDVAAEWIHPTLGWTLKQIVDFMKETPCRVQLCGFNLLNRFQHLKSIAERSGAEILLETNPLPLNRFMQLDYRQNLELFRSRADHFQSESWRQPKTAVISGFCLEESLLFHGDELRMDNDQRAALESLKETTPTPKLKVVWQHQDQDHEKNKINTQLENIVSSTNESPLFSIAADSESAFFDEMAAAIECLQSW